MHERFVDVDDVRFVSRFAGLKLNQFFGNFFVRSTDLLAMPNINPDSAIGVTVDYDESMADGANACFQAALLYTSSRGARPTRSSTCR